MKSLSTNQMAALTAGQRDGFYGNCPQICKNVYFSQTGTSPILMLMATAIWNSRTCRSCYYEGYE